MAKLTVICFALFLFGSGTSMLAQTATQLQDKYGQPVQAYSVSDHIWMTPEFTDDGQLCQMRLYPKRISPTTSYLGQTKLDYGELANLLEQLAPRESRGNPTDVFGQINVSGPTGFATFAYDNVTFTFFFSPQPVVPHSKSSKTRRPEPVKHHASDARDPGGDEMIIFPNAEIAAISWRGRICAKPKTSEKLVGSERGERAFPTLTH